MFVSRRPDQALLLQGTGKQHLNAINSSTEIQGTGNKVFLREKPGWLLESRVHAHLPEIQTLSYEMLHVLPFSPPSPHTGQSSAFLSFISLLTTSSFPRSVYTLGFLEKVLFSSGAQCISPESRTKIDGVWSNVQPSPVICNQDMGMLTNTSMAFIKPTSFSSGCRHYKTFQLQASHYKHDISLHLFSPSHLL